MLCMVMMVHARIFMGILTIWSDHDGLTYITGTFRSKNGMVIDFGQLKKIIQEKIINKFDHALVLNGKCSHMLQQKYWPMNLKSNFFSSSLPVKIYWSIFLKTSKISLRVKRSSVESSWEKLKFVCRMACIRSTLNPSWIHFDKKSIIKTKVLLL